MFDMNQCKHGDKLHVMRDKVFLEVVKEGKSLESGLSGEVVFTDLNNYATPIIRYNGLRDIARFSNTPCSCGLDGLFLEMIEGRKVDSIITPKGRIINPFRLTELISVVEGVAKYQIIQEREDEIKIYLILFKGEIMGESIKDKVITEFRELLKENIKINVEIVENIPRDPNTGMFQLVKSYVKE